MSIGYRYVVLLTVPNGRDLVDVNKVKYLKQGGRRHFENIVTKEEIAHNVQFLLLSQCFPRLVIGYPFSYRDCPLFDKICSKSSAAELSYDGKG